MAGALVIEHMSKTMDEFVVRFAGFQVHKTERTSRTAEPSEFQCVNKWKQNLRHRSKFSRVSAV